MADGVKETQTPAAVSVDFFRGIDALGRSVRITAANAAEQIGGGGGAVADDTQPRNVTSVAGTSSAFTGTLDPAGAIATGTLLWFDPHLTSTLTPTLNVDGIGALPIRGSSGANLVQELFPGVRYPLIRTGSSFRLALGLLDVRMFALEGEVTTARLGFGSLFEAINSHENRLDGLDDDIVDLGEAIDDLGDAVDAADAALDARLDILEAVVVPNGNGTWRLALGGSAIYGYAANWDQATALFNTFEVLEGTIRGRKYYPEMAREREGASRAFSERINNTFITDIVYPFAGYNMIIGLGQSIMAGADGDPAQTTASFGASKMLGTDSRPETFGATYDPVGGADVLYPLVAVDIASAGEHPLIQGTHFLEKLRLQGKGLASDATMEFITGVTAVGGQTMDALQEGHTSGSVELYTRATSFTTKVTALAVTASKAKQVAAIVVSQGESESLALGSPTTIAAFKAQRLDWKNDNVDDLKAITGQSLDPGWFEIQIGGDYMKNFRRYVSDGMGGLTNDNPYERWDGWVAQAQLEFCLNTPRCWMIGSYYPYPDVGGNHPDPNGYRNLGLKVAQVLYRVLVERKDWRPLMPIYIEQRYDVIDIHYHVPNGPLRWVGVFRTDPGTGIPAVYYPDDRGFGVWDSRRPELGLVGISRVEIVASNIVRLKLARVPVGDVVVTYGDENHNGMGNLADSDFIASGVNYVSVSTTPGGYVGAPLPLANHGVIFSMRPGTEIV